MSVKIDQRQNYSADFGGIYRSSGLFYKPKGVKCTISVSNYWEYKNQLNVGLIYSVRDMKGKLVKRKEYNFNDTNVLNIEVTEVEEGAIELEAFSSQNLRIPYAAIMAIYETETNVSMVHTYGRNHSLIELEDKSGVIDAKESCWRVRSEANIRNVAYFHNGHLPVEKHQAKLILSNHTHAEHEILFDVDKIEPFETVAFDIDTIFPSNRAFLDGHDGWASVHFDNNSSFTRLLITWRDKETNEFQVTHSNFDYSEHQTNLVKAQKPAYMKLPAVNDNCASDVIVYPRTTAGKYSVTFSKDQHEFDSKSYVHLRDLDMNSLEFSREDGELPSRIVTAIVGRQKNQKIPFECSFGVIHEGRPPKRFHWAVISKKFNSKMYITKYSEIYGEKDEEITLVYSLYNPNNKHVAKRELTFKSLNEVPDMLEPSEVFGEDFNKLGDDFGYVSLFSHYGGFITFTSVEKNSVISLEHAF